MTEPDRPLAAAVTTGGSSAPSVDAHGNPTIDPTKNVLDLVTAAISRQDDLRVAEANRMNEKADLQHALVREDVTALRSEMSERFRGMDKILEQTEQQRVEQKQDTKAAVDAALTAQKEAVKDQTTASERAIAKSETATTKSIEQQGTTFTTAIEGLRRELADVKERVTQADSQRTGALANRSASMSSVQLSIGAMVLVVSIVAIIITVILSNA